MRHIVIGSLTTAASVGLLLAYPTSHNAGVTAALPASRRATAGAASAASTGSSTTAASGARTSTAAGTRTYDGAAVDTRWGVVQVRITVRGGRVVAAATLQQPNDNGHSQDINAYAVPILNTEAVKAGTSAAIDAVGGATVTSGGYLTSLQSALDAARL